MSGKTGDLVAVLPADPLFRLDPNDEGLFARWYDAQAPEQQWRSIVTTHPFYCQGYEDAEGHPYAGNMWYRFRVDLPETVRSKRVILYVPVVATEAWCWVNGRYVGHRPYREAYERPAQMEVEITDAVLPGRSNVVAFRVNTSLAPAQAAEGIYSRPFLYIPK